MAINFQTQKYDYNKSMKDFVDRISNMLKPQKAFTKVMDYDNYAAPQRAVFQNFVNTNLRPEFERNTLNPYMQNAANQSAATNSMMMGNARNLARQSVNNLETQFADQMYSAKNQNEDLINQGFNNLFRKYYSSPTAFNSI